MQKLTIFLIVIMSAILQLAVFSNVFFWGLGPNIFLLLVIFWTTQEGFESAFSKNIFTGFVYDLILFCPIGMHIVSLTLVAFFVGFISKRFLVVARNWRIFILTMTIIFGTLANNIFLNGLFALENYFGRASIGNAPVSLFSLILAKEVVLNILFFPLIYFLLKRIGRSNFLQVRNKIF